MDKIETAIEMLHNGQVDEAIELLKNASIKTSDDETFAIIEVYHDWGFYDEAIRLLEKLRKKYPNEGQLITKLAELYIELEKDELAIDLLNDIAQDDPFYIQSLLHLADLYQAQGLFEVSEQKLLEAKQLDGEEVVIDFALGELLFSIGQSSRAIPFYERVLQQTTEMNYIAIMERLAESYATIGQYEEALKYYEELDSENPDTLFKYGFTAYQQNRNDIAINVWKELMEKDPHYHTVYRELANAMKEEGLIVEAYKVAEQGLVYDEHNKELYFIAGQLAMQLQNETDSITHLKKAIALDNDYKEAIIALIQLYRNNENNEDIINVIADAKTSGAEDPIYDWELARAYNEEDRYKDALNAYKEAHIHLVHDSEFLKEYGYFLVEEGLIDEALHVLNNYIANEPLDEDVISFVERLNFSKND